jgi:ribosome recycling factor
MNINLSKSKNELKVGYEYETNSMKSEINDKEIEIKNMKKKCEAYIQKLNAENTINEDDKRFIIF